MTHMDLTRHGLPILGLLMVSVLLLSCTPDHTVYAKTDGYHQAALVTTQRTVVWGKQEEAIVTATTWLQNKGFVLVERGRLQQVFNEQRIQLTHSPEDGPKILHVGRILGADAVVFVDDIVRQDRYGGYHLSMAVRGVNTETSEILWSGSALLSDGVTDPESTIRRLTILALERAWCPKGQWTEEQFVPWWNWWTTVGCHSQ